MKIILSGVETNNKGAELMLYAILQEIERKHPTAEVFVQRCKLPQGLGYIKTNLKMRYWPVENVLTRLHIAKIVRGLHLPYKYDIGSFSVNNANYFLDGSGFTFSDQWEWNDRGVMWWDRLLKRIHGQGCKIVFLPQALGPAEKGTTKRLLSVLSKYSTLIMPREKVSYRYLEQSGVVDMTKVKVYSDFTSLVSGYVPDKYKCLNGGVCIIPNMRMIDKGMISLKNYVNLIASIIAVAKAAKHQVFILNHEGKDDELLANQCKKEVGGTVEVVSGLNALEVKGIISLSKLVITSRYHGLASALNSCVPCLSTSWSHKYGELYEDYMLKDCILPLNDLGKVRTMVSFFIEDSNNLQIRRHLKEQQPIIQARTRDMWEKVWNC